VLGGGLPVVELVVEPVVEPVVDGLQEPYWPQVMVWRPCAESTVQLWLHGTVELQAPGQVPPSACSTLPGTSGAGGSSDPDEHPSDASVSNAAAESMRAKVKGSKRFGVDMIFLLIPKGNDARAPNRLDARRRSWWKKRASEGRSTNRLSTSA
jgi:hypothetical protein